MMWGKPSSMELAALYMPGTTGLSSVMGRRVAEEMNSFPSQAMQLDDKRAAILNFNASMQAGMPVNIQGMRPVTGRDIPVKDVHRMPSVPINAIYPMQGGMY